MSELMLCVLGPAGAGAEIRVGDELVIGRDVSGAGGLEGEPALSRRHARIFRGEQQQLLIEDLGSLNGTYVNDERISTPRALRVGDVIGLGATRVEVVKLVSTAAPSSPPPQSTAKASGATVIADRSEVTRFSEPPPASPRRRAGVASRGLLAAAAGVVALIALVWLLLSGGGDPDPSQLENDARRSLVQLVVAPSPVVRALARVAPADAPRSGSAVVVDAGRGLVMTADRLVAGTRSVRARFGGQAARSATVVARAPCEGLALLRVRGLPEQARAANFGTARSLRRGDVVVAVGYQGSRVGDGLRGGRARAVRGRVIDEVGAGTPTGADPRLVSRLVHNAPIGVGGSGGTVANTRGEVIGLHTVIDRRRAVAISAERVREQYRRLIRGSDLRDLGVRLEPWSRIRGTQSPGLLVTGLDQGGPAQRAMLPSGATIFSIRGRAVRTVADVCRALDGARRGDRVLVVADVRTQTVTDSEVRSPSRRVATTLRVRL